MVGVGSRIDRRLEVERVAAVGGTRERVGHQLRARPLRHERRSRWCRDLGTEEWHRDVQGTNAVGIELGEHCEDASGAEGIQALGHHSLRGHLDAAQVKTGAPLLAQAAERKLVVERCQRKPHREHAQAGVARPDMQRR